MSAIVCYVEPVLVVPMLYSVSIAVTAAVWLPAACRVHPQVVQRPDLLKEHEHIPSASGEVIFFAYW